MSLLSYGDLSGGVVCRTVSLIEVTVSLGKLAKQVPLPRVFRQARLLRKPYQMVVDGAPIVLRRFDMKLNGLAYTIKRIRRAKRKWNRHGQSV